MVGNLISFRIVAIGVSNYNDKEIKSLKPCDGEAQEIFDIFCDKEFGSCKREDSRLLISSEKDSNEATRANILDHLTRLCGLTNPDEGLLIYFSGHGADWDDRSYLICKDSRISVLGETALPLTELFSLLRKSKAQFKILILDCCKPGLLLGKATAPMSERFQETI